MNEESLTLEILSDYKKNTKRQFIIILILIFTNLISVGYLIYVLNDIGIEETTTTETIDIDDVDNIQESQIHN